MAGTDQTFFFSTLAEAYAGAVAFQLSNVRDAFAAPGSWPVPVVTTHLGKVAIRCNQPSQTAPNGTFFLATEIPEGTTVPTRYFLAAPGSQQFGIFQTFFGEDTDAYMTFALPYVFGVKATVLNSLTDAAPVTPVYQMQRTAAGASLVGVALFSIQGIDTWFQSMDGLRTIDINDIPDEGLPQAGSPSIPGYAAQVLTGPAGADIVRALQDIALRDLQVSFNHGAQQLSATGGVAIP
jgi:hypothetical protein